MYIYIHLYVYTCIYCWQHNSCSYITTGSRYANSSICQGVAKFGIIGKCVCVCVCVCVYVCVCVCVCGTMVKNVATLKSLCQENNSQDSQDSDDPKRVLRLILDICTGTLFLAFSSCLEISSSQSISSQSIILDFKSILVHATIFY